MQNSITVNGHCKLINDNNLKSNEMCIALETHRIFIRPSIIISILLVSSLVS